MVVHREHLMPRVGAQNLVFLLLFFVFLNIIISNDAIQILQHGIHILIFQAPSLTILCSDTHLVF